MYSEKIKSVANALGTLAGAVDENQWRKIRRARAELWDAAAGVERLENMDMAIEQEGCNGAE
ncbi:MAG: hypothetical protein SWH61_05470 [Thermodesulfobacteriota bacterium]|nr:hypothetical protein [Thermodesulfobacteriota bacterium]